MFLTKHTNKLLEAMHLASTRVEGRKTTLQISCYLSHTSDAKESFLEM